MPQPAVPIPAPPAPAAAAADEGRAAAKAATQAATPTLLGLPRPWLAMPLGGVAIAALLAYAGPGALARAFREASAAHLLLAALAYAAFFVLRGLRWGFLLRSAGVRGGSLLPMALGPVAWMLSTVLPLKAGDAVRAVVLARRREAPLAAVAGTVAVERALDLAGLAFAASVGLAALAVGGTTLPPRLAPLLAVAWLAPIAGLALAFGLAAALRGRPRTSVPLRFLGQLLDGALAIARQPRRMLPAAAWTVAVKAAQISVYVLLLRAFVPGTPAFATAALVPLFLLSFMVAFTPAHVGTYEAAFVLVFAMAGLPPATLAAAAVAVHLSAIAIVSLYGGTCLAAVAAFRPRLAAAAAPTPSFDDARERAA